MQLGNSSPARNRQGAHHGTDLDSTRIVNDLPRTHRQNRSYLQLTRGFGQRAVRDSGNPRASGRGVLIYWHVERKSMAIHSQLISCSASEVAAMIEGAMRHGTTMEVEGAYTDSHGLASSGSASPGCSASTCCPGSSGSTRSGCTGPPPANPTPTPGWRRP